MTTRKGLFIFCIQIILVPTTYTAGFQNETTDDCLTATNINDTTEFFWESMDLDDRDCWKCECPSLCYYGFTLLPRRSLSVRFDEEDEFVWESMNLDEIQNFRYYGLNLLPRRSESVRFDEEAINESEAGHLINEEFEDPYNWFISINESEAGHLINEEFEDPYNWFIYCNHSYHCIDVYLLKLCLSERKVSGFEDVSRKIWFDTINESEAGHLINEEFEDPYTRFIYCNHSYHFIDVYLLKACLSERKVSGFEDVSRKIWFDMSYESEARYLINEEFEHPYSLLTYDCLTATNINVKCEFHIIFYDTTEFVWRRMTLDDRDCWKWECPSLCYYGFNLLPRRSESVRFDEEGFKRPRRNRYVRFDEEDINESEVIPLLNEELEDPYSWFISINESEAIHLLNEEFEDLYSRLISINESEAGHIINEEFEDPYNWFISINESEAIHLLNEEFEDLYSRLIYCSPEIYQPKMLEYKVAFTTRFIEDGPISWIQLEICDTKELNYKTSMESLHGIESTALLATFILTVLSMRIVSEEQLIKDTVSHSLIVKTTTKEARQNLPTKAEEEAVRHCELCINHDQAIAYCMTCKLYICMPCNGLHKRVWTLMNHTVCPFNHM